MKAAFAIFLLSTTPYLAIPLMQQSEFGPIFQFLSELPVLVATIYFFLKLAALHLETMDKLINTFGEREKLQRDHHKELVKELMTVIRQDSSK